MRRLDRHRAFQRFPGPFGWPPSRQFPARRISSSILSIVAVLVALEGWLIADKYYRRKTERPAQLAAAMPAGYKLLANKYYVDEIYGAVLVKPLLAISQYVLGWVVDTAILGGIAWLLAGIANLRE